MWVCVFLSPFVRLSELERFPPVFVISLVYSLYKTPHYCVSTKLCDVNSLVFMTLYILFVIEFAYIPFNIHFLLVEKKKADVKYSVQYFKK